MPKFYITTPIYYASGKPHIGHAFATIYADVISRYKKQCGAEMFFSVGTDEHGSKIAEKAEAQNKAPQKFVDEIAEDFRKLWKVLNIDYSDFIRTTSERHKKGVSEIIKIIHSAGDIYEGIYEGLYCVDCEKFLTEKELKDGLCPDHLRKPQELKEKNYFFNLKKYLPSIRQKILDGELKIIPETRKNETINIIDSGIPDFSMTREKLVWGIPYPPDQSQTIYVWVEALMNYLTILDWPQGELFKKFWPADLHIVGAEISKFHSIFWPAILASVDLPLPRQIFVHGLFTVNSQKMSKTLGNVVDPLKMIDEFGSDVTRYLLLSQFPAYQHGDIKEQGFKAKYNDDLANGIGNLFERVAAMILEYKAELTGEIDSEIKGKVREAEENYKKQFEELNLFEALKSVFSLAKALDKYINEKEPWKTQSSLVLSSLLYGIEEVATLLEPFMPQKARQATAYIDGIKKRKILNSEKLNLFPRKL